MLFRSHTQMWHFHTQMCMHLIRAYTNARTHTHTHANVAFHTQMCMHLIRAYTNVRTHMHTHAYVAFSYADVYAPDLHLHKCTHTRTHTHAHARTRTHTHTHTRMRHFHKQTYMHLKPWSFCATSSSLTSSPRITDCKKVCIFKCVCT